MKIYKRASADYSETANDDRYTAHIKVDIDNAHTVDVRRIRSAMALMKKMGLLAVDTRVYKTRRNHYHVRIWLNKRPADKVALHLQRVLGDDIDRCIVNRYRVRTGIKKWNTLWTTKRERVDNQEWKIVSKERLDRQLTKRISSILKQE